jgi:hypothetical protein
MDDIERYLRSNGGRPWVRKAWAALRAIRPGTESIRETWLRRVAVRAGFTEPEVNKAIFDEHGNFIARVDNVWDADRVVSDYDGYPHDDPERRVRDSLRLRRIEKAGYAMVVATKADYPDGAGYLSALAQAFRTQRRRYGIAA